MKPDESSSPFALLLGLIIMGAGVVGLFLLVRSDPTPEQQAIEADPAIEGTGERNTEREEERLTMVREQIAEPEDMREAIRQKEVLKAMRRVPRHVFVPGRYRASAYEDRALPIGESQTISQPYIVALMTELLKLDADSNVLEVGTGSGYQAAVLAEITPHVTSIEIVEPLYQRVRRTLKGQGYTSITLVHGDGYHGWSKSAPYDAIIVTCAAGHLPPPLWEQLEPGGRIVIPIGEPRAVQRLVVVEKTAEGKRVSRTVLEVRFVPLTRK